jgi:hypothetical protein
MPRVIFIGLLNDPVLEPHIIPRWLALRLETIANILVFATAIFCVARRDQLDPGLVGLSLTYALGVRNVTIFFLKNGASSSWKIEDPPFFFYDTLAKILSRYRCNLGLWN